MDMNGPAEDIHFDDQLDGRDSYDLDGGAVQASTTPSPAAEFLSDASLNTVLEEPQGPQAPVSGASIANDRPNPRQQPQTPPTASRARGSRSSPPREGEDKPLFAKTRQGQRPVRPSANSTDDDLDDSVRFEAIAFSLSAF